MFEIFPEFATLPISVNVAKVWQLLLNTFISRNTGARRSIAETILYEKRQRNLMKALRLSIMHCAVFIIFWTPYSTMATW